jgi:hypothetical protein
MRITLDSLAHTTPPMTVRDAIISAIMKGVYPWVAAEAAGVSRRQFRSWLKSKKPPLRQFARDVRKARGWARLQAEMTLYERDVRNWLKAGPGRESPGKPGWTRDVSPKPDGKKRRQSHPLTDPAWRELIKKMLEARTPYPEARAAMAELLKRANNSDGA